MSRPLRAHELKYVPRQADQDYLRRAHYGRMN